MSFASSPADLPEPPLSARPAILLLGRGSARLPAPMTTLVDREQAVADVVALLRDPGVRLLTLTGPGGVGKTRLAIAAAAEASAAFRDGVAYVALAPVTDPNLVCVATARVLGLREMGEGVALDRIIEFFADQELLLVLDNFEHLLPASTGLAKLLGACPGVTALVTSRVRLRLSGERELTVSPLTLPEAQALSSGDGIEQTGAVRLFIERAQAITPGLNLSPENLQAVGEIVRRVDGLPLAIELAAARVKALPPVALLGRMEQRLLLLTGGARDLPERQQTMRDTIAWSYGLLTVAEEALFRRLAVFVGGFTLSAAEALGAGDDATSAVAIVDGITSLVEQSLLRPLTPLGDEPRYLMLETVREFGLERLEELGEAEGIRVRHAAYFLNLAAAAEPELYREAQGFWFDWLEGEHPNLRTALGWVVDHDPPAAVRLAGALLRYWPIRGRLREGRDWLERALAATSAAGHEDPVARAQGLIALSWVLYWQGDFARGAALAEEASGILGERGDRRGVANVLRALGHNQIGLAHDTTPPDRPRFARAQTIFAEQLRLWRELGDEAGIAAAHHNLGFLAVNAGDELQAEAHLADALRRFEALGDRWSGALSRQHLARVHANQGRVLEAAADYARSLEVFLELGDRWKIAYVLEAVAALLETRQAEVAGQLLGSADALLEADGIQYFSVHSAGQERATTPVRTALGEDRFAAAWAAGRARTLADVVAEAMTALSALGDAAAAAPAAADIVPGVRLTPREREVLRLLASGLSDREIAEALYISPRTAGFHVSNLLGKLGVDSRTAAVALALRHGLG